jgi:hypothetical protein
MNMWVQPTQCHFGRLDDIKGFSCPDAAAKLEAKLKSSSCPLEFYMYERQGIHTHTHTHTHTWLLVCVC